MKFINVILPIPLARDFTYAVPDEWADAVQIGVRVVVPFGNRKMYTAVVSLIHSHKPTVDYAIREIAFPLETNPVLRFPQLKFWEWLSDYYQATMGEVYQAAVPAGLKLESETLVCINPDFEATETLPAREQRVLDALSEGKLTAVSELNRTLGLKNSMPVLKFLLEKGAIEVSEEIEEKYRPKTETYIKLAQNAENEDSLRQIFNDLKRAKKQLDLLMQYIDLSKCLQPRLSREVSRRELLESANASAAVLNSLIEKKIFETYKKEIGRLDFSFTKTEPLAALNEHQKTALQSIEQQFVPKQVVLLHGVTSSGKTEIYTHLIKKTIDEGKQILYLVPEIALTTQLTMRLRRVFGNRLGVYHSRFSDAERVEIWNNLLNNKTLDIIVGVRSSVFLPFRQLGLVIVDEEHEPSYKQFDPAPRYHARNAAIVLASFHGAKTLLGTATPSLESYFNAKTGKYGLVELAQRYRDILLPEIQVVDTKEAYRKKMMTEHFSDVLQEAIAETLKRGEQAILFQNRRGYAPFYECKQCAYVPKCKNCDVTLTVHKFLNVLTCHYCGYAEPIPEKCPVCNAPELQPKGFGTERIEDEITALFPAARVVRMDLDTTRTKKSYERIISDFENGQTDILVGTQMITKGLDFANVSLVGILNADNLFCSPDFRSHERAFQLMAQVGGRAGRKDRRGLVVIQTSQPQHAVIKQVMENDFMGMYETQMEERQNFKYPPYYRLIQILLKHKEITLLKDAANTFGKLLRADFGNRIFGPVDPPVSRIKTYYIKQFFIKFETEASPSRVKEILRKNISKLLIDNKFKSIKVAVDIDPL
ncbi:MAG: primosomal protein N' [Paludibacter sp.]|jgi:primosomal protein N' (replication factor Y)|nr:primosomal protein N' [Paludibacter sp.]